MEKTKADLDAVKKELKPFLKREFLQKTYIDSSDVTVRPQIEGGVFRGLISAK